MRSKMSLGKCSYNVQKKIGASANLRVEKWLWALYAFCIKFQCEFNHRVIIWLKGCFSQHRYRHIWTHVLIRFDWIGYVWWKDHWHIISNTTITVFWWLIYSHKDVSIAIVHISVYILRDVELYRNICRFLKEPLHIWSAVLIISILIIFIMDRNKQNLKNMTIIRAAFSYQFRIWCENSIFHLHPKL